MAVVEVFSWDELRAYFEAQLRLEDARVRRADRDQLDIHRGRAQVYEELLLNLPGIIRVRRGELPESV